MDLKRFGLKRRPFRPTPDLEAFHNSNTHQSALNSLHDALDVHESIALVDGPGGIGKTLIALKFLANLDEQASQIFIPAARFHQPAELHQAILFDFGCEYRGLSDTELRLTLIEQILAKMKAGQCTVIVLDEAQHLSDGILEEIRLLGNLETFSTKGLFFVLVAQPILRARLAKVELLPISQRIGTRARLEPLSSDESKAFLKHQITVAGGHAEEFFAEEALSLLAENCNGIPRLLNQVANNAMVLAASDDGEIVDSEAVLEAFHRFGLTPEIAEPVINPVTILAKPNKAMKDKQTKRSRLPKRRSA